MVDTVAQSAPTAALFHPPTSSFVFGLNANLRGEEYPEEPFVFGSPKHRFISNHYRADGTSALRLSRTRLLKAPRRSKSILDEISDIEKAIYFARTVFSPTYGSRKP